MSGAKLFAGSSVVILHWIAYPLGFIASCEGIPTSLELNSYPFNSSPALSSPVLILQSLMHRYRFPVFFHHLK